MMDHSDGAESWQWLDEDLLDADVDERTLTWSEFGATIGRRLRAARKAQGLSQEEVARHADIAAFTYQKLEHGLARPGVPMNPRLATLVALCRALGLTLDDLVPQEWPTEIPSVDRGRRRKSAEPD